MTSRLFHTIVLVGAALGAASLPVACGGREDGSADPDAGTVPDTGFARISDNPDSGWPKISTDTSVVDTWPGIRPADAPPPDTKHDAADADAADGPPDTGWSGILPPPSDAWAPIR